MAEVAVTATRIRTEREKERQREWTRAWRLRNREAVNAKKQERRASRTPEQRDKDSIYSVAWRKTITPEQKARHVAQMRERWRNLAPEQKRELGKKRQARESEWPEEKIEEKKIRNRSYWHNLDPKRKAEVQKTQREWLAANPDKTRAKVNRRRARLASVGGSFTTEEWKELLDRFDHRCPMCGRREPEINLTIDHIIPLSMGGPNSIENIQPLCGACNSSKGHREIVFWVMGRINGDCSQRSILQQ